MPKIKLAAQLMEPEEVHSYEMLPGEGQTRFHAFVHFRDLMPGKRGVAKAWADHAEKCLGHPAETLGHKMCPNRWREWGTAWNWKQRATDWDREVDRAIREKEMTTRVETAARHKQLAEMSLAALSVPGRVVLTALQDPTVMARMIQDARASTAGMMKFLDMVTWATKNMPGMVDVERMALGMGTEALELTVKSDSTGLEIAQDRESVDLAIQLVSRMANVGIGERSLTEKELGTLPAESEAREREPLQLPQDTLEGELVPQPVVDEGEPVE